MAFDPASNSTVFLGGDSAGSIYRSWTYSDYNWSAPFTGIPDVFPGLAYDSSDAELIAFGGLAPIAHEVGTTIPTNATFAFVGGTWVNLTSELAAGPPAAPLPLMASDLANDSALLLDPVGSGNASQTWSFSNGSWTNLTATAGTPPPGPGGADSAMVYDPFSGGVIFLGGSVPGPAYPTATNETWEFRDGRWSDLNISGPDFATGTVQTMGFDGPADALVDLVAPSYLYSASGQTDYQDWEYLGGTWTNETSHLPATPPVGYDPLSVWDPADGYLFYLTGGFGGQSWALGSLPLRAQLAIAPSTVDIGNSTTFDVTADGGAPPLRYSFSGLPPGCSSFSEAELTCFPSGAGTFTVQVFVEDYLNDSANAAAQVQVGLRLTATGPLLAEGTIYNRSVVTFSVTPSGGLPPYDFQWDIPPLDCLPPDQARFSCAVDQSGSFEIEVNVSDVTQEANVTVWGNLTVVVPPTITSFASSASKVEVGESFELTTEVAGGAPGLEYTYTNLPIGCPARSAPILTCSPTGAGSYIITVAVTDGLGTMVNASVNVTVVANLTITNLEISPNPAPVGSTVTFGYSVLGGEGPFHSDWVDLPPECAASQATFTCTVNATGSYSVGLTVRDALGGTARSNLTLSITPGAAPTKNSAGLGTIPLGAWGALGLGVAIVVGVVMWDRGRRRNDPTATPPDGSRNDEAIIDGDGGAPPGYEPPPTFPGDGSPP